MTKSFDMTLNCKGTAHRPTRDHNSYKDNAHFAVPLLAAEHSHVVAPGFIDQSRTLLTFCIRLAAFNRAA